MGAWDNIVAPCGAGHTIGPSPEDFIVKDKPASAQIAEFVGHGVEPFWSDYNDASGLAVYLVDGNIVMLRAEALRISHGEIIEAVGRWTFEDLIAKEIPAAHVESRYAEDFDYLNQYAQVMGHDCGFLHVANMGSSVFIVRANDANGDPEIKIGVVSGNHNTRSASFQATIREDMIPAEPEYEHKRGFAL